MLKDCCDDGDVRCQEHPEFNPHKNHMFRSQDKYITCEVCRCLNDGAKPVGAFNGEFRTTRIANDRLKIKIGPLNLEHFGHVRYVLWTLRQARFGCIMSYVDEKTRTVYLTNDLAGKIVEMLRDKMGYQVDYV